MFEVGNLVETTPDGTSLFNPTNRKAVVTDTTALDLYGFIGVVWLGGNPDARDGLFMANFFQHAEQDIYADTPSGGAGMTITQPPYAIGDVVKFSYPLDNHEREARFIVIMTDWHRKTVSDEYIESIKSCLDDDDDADAAFYVENPTYVYVLPIGYEPGAVCDGHIPTNLVRVATVGEVCNLLTDLEAV